MTSEEIIVFVGVLVGLLGILAIAIGATAGVLIGEGEVRLMDSTVLLRDVRLNLGADANEG